MGLTNAEKRISRRQTWGAMRPGQSVFHGFHPVALSRPLCSAKLANQGVISPSVGKFGRATPSSAVNPFTCASETRKIRPCKPPSRPSRHSFEHRLGCLAVPRSCTRAAPVGWRGPAPSRTTSPSCCRTQTKTPAGSDSVWCAPPSRTRDRCDRYARITCARAKNFGRAALIAPADATVPDCRPIQFWPHGRTPHRRHIRFSVPTSAVEPVENIPAVSPSPTAAAS